MSRVLVLGARGMLGSALVYYLPKAGIDIAVASRPEFDANNPDFSVIERLQPRVVVNAIGLTNRHLDQAETCFLRTNSLFPRRLADWCCMHGLPLIHVSTDCVFKGDAGPYDEHAQADALDVYGQSKHWGEPANAMVLRTSIVGPELHNYYSLLCWFLAQAGMVLGYRNHRWNGITTLELARVIGVLISNDLCRPGVRHIYGDDLTKLDLLRLAQAAYDKKDVEVVPWDDAFTRDTRLRTIYPDFLEALAIQPMSEQLKKLRELTDGRGHWSEIPGNSS
jgi:dTDP-4-dehydrorhamnose reductase